MSKAAGLNKHLSIHAASKACGLSPSVLRIWELRYGWPNPARRPNGYRAYSRHLIEDLKRVATMVNEGMPISEIILDGMPNFPAEPETVDAHKRTIDVTRRLPEPPSHSAKRLQKQVFGAIEQRSGGQIDEIMQRANWELRPQEELLVVLAPALLGLLEQMPRDKDFQDSELGILRKVERRALQLARRMQAQGPEVVVATVKPKVPAIAAVTALALRQRGVNAVAWTDEGMPEGSYLSVKMQGTTKRKEYALLIDDDTNFLSLFDQDFELPWRQAA